MISGRAPQCNLRGDPWIFRVWHEIAEKHTTHVPFTVQGDWVMVRLALLCCHCRKGFFCCTLSGLRMLTWIVATSTSQHCTTADLDACRSLAEACRDRQFFTPRPSLTDPSLGSGVWSWSEDRPALHGLRSGRVRLSRMAIAWARSPKTGEPSCANRKGSPHRHRS